MRTIVFKILLKVATTAPPPTS
jgi:hypothetical protein